MRHLKDIGLPTDIETAFLNRMIDVPGSKSTPSIVKGLDWALKSILTDLSHSRKKIVRDIIMPLELIINDFGLALLENSHSYFVDNGEAQVKDLRQKTKDAITAIENVGNSSLIEKLQMNLKKLELTGREHMTLGKFIRMLLRSLIELETKGFILPQRVQITRKIKIWC